MMTERKRRSEDGRDMDAQPPAGLTKKRHTAKDNEFQAGSAEFDESAAMLDLESIREFQKEAIWRQMQEYKRDAARAQQQATEIERRQARWAERIAGVCTLWDQTARDLDAIAGSAEEATADAEHGALIDVVLPIKSPRRAGDGEDAAQSSLEQFSASVGRVLKQLGSKSAARTGVDWEAAADRLARARVPQSEVDALRARVALLSRQLADDKDALEQRETELRRALKRLDRTVCPTVSGGGGGGGGSNSSAAGEVQAHQPEKEREREEEDGAEAPEKAVKAVKAEQASPADVAEKADYVLLAERRLGEIEEKVRENAQLQSLVDELRLQMASVPDHIIAESALYRQAEASRNFYGAQAQRLQAEVERLFGEVASLRTSRGEFEAGVVAEAGAQRQALEAEMQRQHGDLVRVRHHRDQIQRELDERRAQDAVEDQKSAELKLLSDVRRERMNALISENKRLLAYVAVLRGDRAAFETYTDDELSKTAAVADELRAKLEQALRREASRADPSRAEADLASAREEVAALQARVRECEAALGAGDAAGELAAKQRSVEALALQRDGLQKTSAMLERELQAVCESFARLEAQNTSRVWDLGTKEAAVARVVAEKAKYEEKFIGLNKDLGAQRQANHALRQQSAKQLEHISAVEDRDRALSQQLALVAAEAEHAAAAWQAAAAQLLAAQQRNAELELQARALEDRVRIATHALDERTEALAAAEHDCRRSRESLDLATRRITDAERPPADHAGLAKLCADYKALLKCPTCQTNFKSHVLLRCMHVFCKQCVDSRIETRQRKCPSCSEPFGAKDVRQIYL